MSKEMGDAGFGQLSAPSCDGEGGGLVETTPTMSCRGADELVLVRGSCRLNGMAQSSLPITQ